jgi:hypothetical protein
MILSRAHLGEEAVDRAAQHARLIVELARILQHLGRRRAGSRRRRGDAADMGADLAGACRRRLNVAGDLARRIALTIMFRTSLAKRRRVRPLRARMVRVRRNNLRVCFGVGGATARITPRGREPHPLLKALKD